MPCSAGRVVGHRRVALGAPVAQRVARAGADHQRRARIRNQSRGVVARHRRQRAGPSAARRSRTPSASAKPKKAVEHVLAGARRDARIREQPLQLARARAVESELHGRRDACARQAGAEGELHVQQHVEAAARKLLGAVRDARRQAGALVHGDKLHALDQTHEARFGLADDPRELRLRPGLLQRAQHRHDVAGIADGRQPSRQTLRGGSVSGSMPGARVNERQWPLGSEVKRKDLTGGAMLYDASRAGNLAPAWFDPEYWRERGELEGEARGRGTVHFIRIGERALCAAALPARRARRAALQDRYLWRSEQHTRPFARVAAHSITCIARGCRCPRPWRRATAQRHRLHRRPHHRAADGLESLAGLAAGARLPILSWIAIGRCIRAFHELGVCHADLNAHNCWWARTASCISSISTAARCASPACGATSNLVRLRRSLEKITYGLPPEHFSEADWHGLLDGYQRT